MEKESDHKFDEFIHSEMSDFRIEPTSEDQWERLYADLDKAAVKSSYWKKFNIVYISAIATTVIVLIFVFLNFSNNKSTTSQPTPENNTNDSISSAPDKSLIQQSNDHLLKPGKTSGTHSYSAIKYRNMDLNTDSKNDSNNSNNMLTNTSEIAEQANKVQDSLNVSKTIKYNETETLQEKQAVQPKPKKIRYVTKRDTLIIVDTTITKKKR